MVALFSAGRAVFMINGNWEVPTMVDLQKQGKLPFEYGIVAMPKFFENQETWADSHQLAIPNNEKSPASPEKVAAALKFISYFVKQTTWAGGGHIPAYLPVQESAEFKAMKPNSDYVSLAKTAVFDPVSIYAGVASPVYDASGNYMIPALNGEIAPADAAKKIRDDLQGLTK